MDRNGKLIWIYYPNVSLSIEVNEAGEEVRRYEFRGLTDEYCGDSVKTKLGLTHEEAWTLWAAYVQRPSSCFVTGCPARPYYRREGKGGWAISHEGMPYLLPKTERSIQPEAMEIE